MNTHLILIDINVIIIIRCYDGSAWHSLAITTHPDTADPDTASTDSSNANTASTAVHHNGECVHWRFGHQSNRFMLLRRWHLSILQVLPSQTRYNSPLRGVHQLQLQ